MSQDASSASSSESESDSSSSSSKPVKKVKKEPSPDASSITTTSSTKTKKKHSKAAKDVSKSPFTLQTTSLYLPLSPISQKDPVAGVCAEHLSPLILTYSTSLNGIVLSYANVRLSSAPPPERRKTSGSSASPAAGRQLAYAKAIDEYASPFVWVTADFLCLRPRRGVEMEGYINVQSESHIGIICLNLFSASVERKRLPAGWRWNKDGTGAAAKKRKRDGDELQGQGHWVDERGKKVDGKVEFRIKDFEASAGAGKDHGYMNFEGTLLGEEAERELLLLEAKAFREQRDAGRRH